MADPKSFTSMMDEKRKFEPSEDFRKQAHINSMRQYEEIYQQSIEDPEGFWAKEAEKFEWFKKWDRVHSWDPEKIDCKWFEGGKLNITVNCLDRHLETWRKNKAAIIWEGNEPGVDKTFTYQELHREVSKFGNVLRDLGVKKGDRVAIYMPMVAELAIAMLACARIGAVHSIVFGGFSPESLSDRILDSECGTLITTDGTFRGAKAVPLKDQADAAMDICEKNGFTVKNCVVYEVVGRGKGIHCEMRPGRDHWWHEVMKEAGTVCEAEVMDAEDPLFILYTSGSTGKPKGVLHTIGGYMIYASLTHKYIFDIKDEDTYWCTADIGWVTGHSYIVYGPLANGATSMMFEGVPTYPDAGRFWKIVEKHRVNIFYTAPTAIRALMRFGDDFPKKYDISSLRLLGTVGEPINPEAWMWYYNVIGNGNCPIVDTWWQTETGGMMITPFPGAMTIKPGSACKPFFGIQPAILKDDGTEAGVNEGGYLVIRKPWPGMMRTLYGHHERFVETYFSQYPGIYFTGDGARVDEDGYFWLLGRVDDVINISGHRIGTAEVESALVSHDTVTEAAVVGMPHEIKGQGLYAYVTLKQGLRGDEELRKVLVQHVSKEIGPIAKPEKIQFTDALPKTRSGKIMRRILRKIAEDKIDELGDTSTLADPKVVDSLVENRL